MKKSTKSQQGGLAPSSFQTTGGVHELVARSSAWQVRAARGKVVKVGSFAAPHSFIYTTRANISHEIAEQIRARIACTPAYKCRAGVNLICALTGWKLYFLFLLLALLEFYLVGVGAVDAPLLSRGEHCSPAKRTLKEKYYK